MFTTRPKDRVHRMFRALSDRTRLRILQLLRGGELCVGDLVETLVIPQAKTSRHLAYLRKSGLVRVREEGIWCFYSLSPAGDPLHRKLLECLGVCFQDVPEIEADARRAQRIRKRGGCCPK